MIGQDPLPVDNINVTTPTSFWWSRVQPMNEDECNMNKVVINGKTSLPTNSTTSNNMFFSFPPGLVSIHFT